MNADVRWKQRFQNFERAFALLEDSLQRGSAVLSSLEKEGVIQRFEYTFELGWKTLKDFMEESGLVITPLTPREVIKQGFAAKVITDGQAWIDMLQQRNLLSHTYDEAVFAATAVQIENSFLSTLRQLRDALRKQAGA